MFPKYFPHMPYIKTHSRHVVIQILGYSPFQGYLHFPFDGRERAFRRLDSRFSAAHLSRKHWEILHLFFFLCENPSIYTYLQTKLPLFWMERAFFWRAETPKQRTNRFQVDLSCSVVFFFEVHQPKKMTHRTWTSVMFLNRNFCCPFGSFSGYLCYFFFRVCTRFSSHQVTLTRHVSSDFW